MIDVDKDATPAVVTFLVLAASAISVGVLGAFDYNIATELLEDPQMLYIAVGAVGVFGLTEAFGYTEVLDK